jgi:hypothetical protein
VRKTNGLSYRNALAVLGKHEHALVATLDRIAGGMILAGGVVAPGALALLDVKNEASSLLRQLLGKVSQRLTSTTGLTRIESTGAAHSILVVSAFFGGLREGVGERLYDRKHSRLGGSGCGWVG